MVGSGEGPLERVISLREQLSKADTPDVGARSPVLPPQPTNLGLADKKARRSAAIDVPEGLTGP